MADNLRQELKNLFGEDKSFSKKEVGKELDSLFLDKRKDQGLQKELKNLFPEEEKDKTITLPNGAKVCRVDYKFDMENIPGSLPATSKKRVQPDKPDDRPTGQIGFLESLFTPVGELPKPGKEQKGWLQRHLKKSGELGKELSFINKHQKNQYVEWRKKNFRKRYKEEIKSKPEIPKDYEEPDTFLGQLVEGVESFVRRQALPGIGYTIEQLARTKARPQFKVAKEKGEYEITAPEGVELHPLTKLGNKIGDEMRIEALKHPELLAPKDMKPLLKGGWHDSATVGRVMGEAIGFMGSAIGTGTVAGLLGGPHIGAITTYSSTYSIVAGNSYQQYLEEGMDPKKANTLATARGLIHATTENMFGLAPTRITTSLVTKPAKKVVFKSFADFLQKGLKRIGYNTVRNVLEEGTEESVQQLTDNLLNNWWKEEKTKVGKGLAEAFAQGVVGTLAFGWMGSGNIDFIKGAKIGSEKDMQMMKEGEIEESASERMGKNNYTHKAIKTIQEWGQKVSNSLDRYRFLPEAPMKLRNDFRTEVIGGTRQIWADQDALREYLMGGLTDEQADQALNLIWARNEVGRQKQGKGNPDLSWAKAKGKLNKIKQGADKEAIEAANKWNNMAKQTRKQLVEMGFLEEDQGIENYAPVYVKDYTPDWSLRVGIPTQLKTPYKSYTKRAEGTEKEFHKSLDALTGYWAQVQSDILLEKFIKKQMKRYDAYPSLSREQKVEHFGTDKANRVRRPLPGRTYYIEDREGISHKYRAYSPDTPFYRQIFMSEEGVPALGRVKNVALIPEPVYNTFKQTAAKGSKELYYINRLTGWWKTMAILSHFPSFNVTNFLGDSYVALMQCPEKQKLLKELPTSFSILRKTMKGKELSPYEKEVWNFIQEEDILGATFMQNNLPRLKRSKSPWKNYLRKGLGTARTASNYREAFMRTAYASYLYREGVKRGRAKEIIETHDWIDTSPDVETDQKGTVVEQELSTQEKLGKISRDIVTDYSWISKGYRRHLKGLLSPFVTIYTKTTGRIFRMVKKHPLKVAAALSAPAMASIGWNYSDDERRELEEQLPGPIRDQVHFVLGKNPDGTIKIWMPTFLPNDIIFGSDIFNKAPLKAMEVATGKKKIGEAAKELLRDTAGEEYRKVTNLVTPVAQVLYGIATGKDPFDQTPIYPRDPSDMTALQRRKFQAIFLGKKMLPPLASGIREWQERIPADVAVEEILEGFAGQGAIGVYDIDKKGKIHWSPSGTDEEVELTWDQMEELQKFQSKEAQLVNKIEDKWVESGKVPRDFVETDLYKNSITDVWNLWKEKLPGLEKKYPTKEKQLEFVQEALGERLANRLGQSPDSAERWYKIQRERAETKEEKERLNKKYQKMRKEAMIEIFRRRTKTAREIYLRSLLREAEMK